MNPPRIWKEGEELIIECDGERVTGTVLLASANGTSLAVGFEAILAGCVGMMPIFWDPETKMFRCLVGRVPVLLKPVIQELQN